MAIETTGAPRSQAARQAVGAGLLLLTSVSLGGSLAAPGSGDRGLEEFSAAWAGVETYRCTISEHEVEGDQVQDRVYELAFRKPHDTRLEIVAGQGKGGVLVWHGGPEARGHQGGWLRFIDLTVDIHDPRATTIRGTTVAQANFGFLLDHLRSLDALSLHVTSRGEAEVEAVHSDPSAEGGISREVLVLGHSGLPVAYRQFKGSRVVRAVSYHDLKLNVPIPESTFDL